MAKRYMVDGLAPDGSLTYWRERGTRAPYYIFDADKQDHVSKRFRSRLLARLVCVWWNWRA